MAIGFGVNNGAAWAADPTALKTIADTFVGHWFGTLIEIGGMCAAFIVCVACATAATRTLFAMGRESVLPRWFGHTHPRFKTPVNATIAVAVVATGMALLIGYPLSDSLFGQPFSNYYFWATLGTLAIIVVYVMLCLGGIVFFAKTRATRRWNPLVHVLVPLIGAVVFGAALYGSVHPAPPGILALDALRGAGLAGAGRRRGALAARAAAGRGGAGSAPSSARRAARTRPCSTPATDRRRGRQAVNARGGSPSRWT